MATAARFGLRSLIQPRTDKEFYRDHWTRSPLVSHGSVERFGELSRIPQLLDVRSLCAAARNGVFLFGKKGFRAALTNALDAVPFYEKGKTLYFTALEESIPAVAELAAMLAADLGVSPAHVAVEAFASLDGSGASMHFDFEQNFNVQLRGRKTWLIAPNECIINPMQSYAVGDGRLHVQLKAHSTKSYPTRMPSDSRTIEVREGSSLYLPRGFWHETVAKGESFAVCFAVKPPVVANLVLDALRQRLLQDERWREAACGLARSQDRRALRAQLLQLLPALVDVVKALEPAHVVPGDVARRAAYAWPAGAKRTLSLEKSGGQKRWILNVSAPKAKPVRIEVDDVFLLLVKWMMGQPGRFTPPYDNPDLGLPAAQLDQILYALAEMGAVRAFRS